MNTTLYVYTLKTIIFKQEHNTVSNNRFFACVISILAKNLKTKQNKTKQKNKKKKKKKPFPKNFFIEFWIIVGEYEYIYIAEVKFGNCYLCVILGAIFFCIPKMLIYANLRENDGADLIFFFKQVYPGG